MGDKLKTDTSKSVKNPLLSAARTGFTIDSFGGSSLLVPVSENSSSVLPDDAGQAHTLSISGQDSVSALATDVSAGPPLNSAPPPISGPPPATSSSAPQGFATSLNALTSSLSSHLNFFSPTSTDASLPPNLFQSGDPPAAFYPPPPTAPVPAPGPPTSFDAGLHPVSLSSEPATGPEPTFYNLYNPQDHQQNVFSAPVTSSTPPFPSSSSSPALGVSPALGFVPQTSYASAPAFGANEPSFAAGPPPSAAPPLNPPPSSGSNNFRLGNQKRLTYAPVPGLNSSARPGLPELITQPHPQTPSSYFLPPEQPSFPAMATSMMSTTTSPTTTPSAPPQSGSPTLSVLPNNMSYLSDDQLSSAIASLTYRNVYHHWFYKLENKQQWLPFSMTDSLALETSFTSPDLSPETVVPTDGSRYDVNILRRQRTATYWEEATSEVRRCSWFYKSIDNRFVPYDENVSARFEEEYKIAMTANEWNRRLELPNEESVVFHGPSVIVHYLTGSSPDAWGNTPTSTVKYRVLKRGVDEIPIEDGEPSTVDHLLFIVHGIGSSCDLQFRSLVEVVDDFRSISLQLVQSHFSSSVDTGAANRVEVLPVSWHAKLHSEEIENQLTSLTLPSIPKLRHLTNDALIDVLFYTSPIYCQTIVQTVVEEMNRIYNLFLKRNPGFSGGVSLGGHSLGSLILFDVLCHQKPKFTPSPTPATSPVSQPAARDGSQNDEEDDEPPPEITLAKMRRRLSRRVSYVMGPAGTGQPYITYPQISFQPKNFFALGSPIGLFASVRGIDSLGEDFALPTCPSFFNIFHPYDLVAYRIEPLILPDIGKMPPELIPHHKGRKRMHLELKETVQRMGADIKQKILDSVRTTWNTVYQLTMFHRNDESLTQEMNKVLEDEMQQSINSGGQDLEEETNITVGKLNGGRRIDYVLQEAPLESFNDYLFAIGAHVCYWKSEDTMLLMLKEMYRSIGVCVDSQLPQQHLNPPIGPTSPQSTVDVLPPYLTQPLSDAAQLEPSPCFPTNAVLNQTNSLSSPPGNRPMGMDPTAPPSDSRRVGPPPTTGFYRK